MSKKQDSYYFQNFIACAEYSCRAAHLLKDIMSHFDPALVSQKLDEMHKVEHEADLKKHEMLNMLVKAFITPIEREDIMQVSQNLDDMTDQIEDVLIKIYYNGISSMRTDALEMADVLIRCCEETLELMKELADFKRSKRIHVHIVRINTLEEEADKRFIACMYQLHNTCKDPLEVIAWREVYNYIEKCIDTCEHVADTVEGIIMKNS